MLYSPLYCQPFTFILWLACWGDIVWEWHGLYLGSLFDSNAMPFPTPCPRRNRSIVSVSSWKGWNAGAVFPYVPNHASLWASLGSGWKVRTQDPEKLDEEVKSLVTAWRLLEKRREHRQFPLDLESYAYETPQGNEISFGHAWRFIDWLPKRFRILVFSYWGIPCQSPTILPTTMWNYFGGWQEVEEILCWEFLSYAQMKLSATSKFLPWRRIVSGIPRNTRWYRILRNSH